MTNYEQNIITELEDMLDDIDHENITLRKELENTKSDLILTLERLLKYQDIHITKLQSIIDDLE